MLFPIGGIFDGSGGEYGRDMFAPGQPFDTVLPDDGPSALAQDSRVLAHAQRARTIHRARRAWQAAALLLLPTTQAPAPVPTPPSGSVQVVQAERAIRAHLRPVQVLKPAVALQAPGLSKLPPAQIRLTRRPVERTASAQILVPVTQAAVAATAPTGVVLVVATEPRAPHAGRVVRALPRVPLAAPATGITRLPVARLVAPPHRPDHRHAAQVLLPYTLVAPIQRSPAARVVAAEPRAPHGGTVVRLAPRANLQTPDPGIVRLPIARVIHAIGRERGDAAILQLAATLDPGITRRPLARVVQAEAPTRHRPVVLQLAPAVSPAAPDPGVTRAATARVVPARHVIRRTYSATLLLPVLQPTAVADPGITRLGRAKAVQAPARLRDRWSVTQLGPVVPLGAADPGIVRRPAARVVHRPPAPDVQRLPALLLPYTLVAPLERLPVAKVVAPVDARPRDGRVLRLAPRAGLVPPLRLAPTARVVSQKATIERHRRGLVRWVAPSDYLGLPTFLHLDFEAVGLPALRFLAVAQPTLRGSAAGSPTLTASGDGQSATTYTADGAPTLRLEDA